MLCEAKKIGWPKAYVNDLLVHDAAFCATRDPSEPFYWNIRETGTSLAEYRHEMYSIVKAMGGEVFYWDGNKLHFLTVLLNPYI